jgi:RNA polymerase primary sigma factor
MDPRVRVLVESGKKRGFVTYEEMNLILPNDIENIDEVLTLLEELGIEILDEADVTEEQEQDSAGTRPEVAVESIEKSAPAERIDDPVRMYLTQMG